MKKFIFSLGLVALVSFASTSCSTDDSALETTKSTSADDFTKPGPGDVDLPKPTGPRL
ncbi:hypothetical protein GR160_07035 [Flavobacterium sp. Sd200]|uniref:hypothetical protein n=1 Tax=Flavobacterium sp. Sd200 TaxID=2692211 RepID=UPI001370C049|nr:hypothetical protein [Flavobacterium sp. Sd200]MXN90979.1 hypothetical protein [Flavobacterium sp. Sd200]